MLGCVPNRGHESISYGANALTLNEHIRIIDINPIRHFRLPRIHPES